MRQWISHCYVLIWFVETAFNLRQFCLKHVLTNFMMTDQVDSEEIFKILQSLLNHYTRKNEKDQKKPKFDQLVRKIF